MIEEIIDVRMQTNVCDDELLAEVNENHNVNSRFLNEAKHLESRWLKVEGYIDNIKDRYKRMAIAVMLENQRLMNEAATGTDIEGVRKKLVPLVRSVFTKLKAWDWISIQPLLGPVGILYYLRKRDEGIKVESEDIAAKTRLLKRQVASDFGVEDVSSDLVNEIDTEVLTDLWNNCGYRKDVDLNVKTIEQFRQVIVLLQDEMRVNGHEPNFLVVNPRIYHLCNGVFANTDSNLKIYKHSAVSGVFLGRKGTSYLESGYFYSPYIPFTTTPVISENGKNHGFMTRYGKKLLREGSRYYGKITVTLSLELEAKL
jgi:hypothetical protein